MIRDGLVRTAGFLLLAVPFVPLARLYPPGADAIPVHVEPTTWMLGLFVFGASSWLVSRVVPAVPRLLARGLAGADARLTGRTGTLLALGALTGLLILAGSVVFARRPLLVDSVVQLFQAKIFASGALTAPAPPGEAFVATQHMLVRGGHWFSQYPPGHAALLALGVIVDAPWIVPVALTLGTAALLHRFAASAWDATTGRLTLVLALFSPFFWIMGASFMNHVSCLFFTALFLVCFQLWERGERTTWALAAGLAIGAAGLARPLTALAVAAVFAPIGIAEAVRRRDAASVALAGAGGLVSVVLYLWFNAATTGHPLVPGYLELWGASHGLGFHTSPWGIPHTPWTGIRNELVDLALLAEFFLEWPIPALAPVGLYLAIGGSREKWDRRMVAGLLIIPAIYLFYWHRDAYLGPRYLYAGLAFLLPLTARALLSIRRLPDAGPLRLRGTAMVVVVLSCVYTAAYAAPRRVAAYGSSLASMKVDVPSVVREAGVERGVVFVAVSWGNRLLARMRGAGVSASTAEQAYRRSDHCAIERLLRRGRTENWPRDRFEAEVSRLPTAGLKLGRASPNGDPTLRLVPGTQLDPVCRTELAHDAPGYGNWLPRLPDIDPELQGDILFVRDLRDLNGEFLAERPGRSAWLYRPTGLASLAEPALPSRPVPRN